MEKSSPLNPWQTCFTAKKDENDYVVFGNAGATRGVSRIPKMFVKGLCEIFSKTFQLAVYHALVSALYVPPRF